MQTDLFWILRGCPSSAAKPLIYIVNLTSSGYLLRSVSPNSNTGVKSGDRAQLSEDFACTKRADRDKTPPQPLRSH
jgi:hypothetical protein